MISIIIVGYNSKKYLDDCLSSIFNSNYKNSRVIFVDNNSTDDSIKFIKNKFRKVIIVKSKENLGFAGGNNLGIKKAIEMKTDYIFLVNPDTITERECFEILIKNANTKTILQPLILLYKNGHKTKIVNTTGGILNFLGFSYCSDYKKDAKEIIDKNIPLASGAGVFIPSEVFRKIGFFDENFFMYHEDVDLFWRARMSGFEIELISSAIIWHKYSFSRNINKMFYFERNRLLFLYKNFSVKYLGLIFPMFIINEFLMLLYSLFSGWFWLKLNSYVSIFKLLKKESNQRKEIIANKIISDKLLKRFIVSDISFSEIRSIFFAPYNFLLKIYWKLINMTI